MDWDEIRFFLAVARARSVSAAAGELGVNQATVSRRIAALERGLGVRLFDKRPSGYTPTGAGEAILEQAMRMADEADALERRVLGRDERLSGRLRVTMSDVVAIYLVLPRLEAFRRRYPDIELEFLMNDATLNLNARQAEVAVRIADRVADNLVGRRIATLRYGVYVSKAFRRRHRDLDRPDVDALTWYHVEGQPSWVRKNFPRARVQMRFDSVLSVVAAARAGMGMALVPCFVGEQESDLVRVPTAHEEPGWGVWVLSHPDLRATARVKAFRDFVSELLVECRPLLAPKFRV